MSTPPMSLQSFVRKFNDTTVKVDKRFQRRKVWDLTDKREYLHSLSQNWVRHQNIVVADIAACLEYSQTTDPSDNRSHEYFQDILSAGYKYLSLDGQNRTFCLNEFASNDIHYKGTMSDADGKMHTISNHTFDELPQRVRDLLNTGALISVVVVEEITSNDLRKFFLSYNGGCPLKAQERRHAEPTPLSVWVETRAQKYQKSGAAPKLHTKGDISRMKDNELITKMTMGIVQKVLPNTEKVQAPFNFRSKDLDIFYRIGNGAFDMAHSCYDTAEMSRASDLIDTTMRAVAAQKDKTDKNEVWALLWGIQYAHDTGQTIQSLNQFYREVIKIDEKLKTDSKVLYAQDELTAQKQGLPSPQVSNYYHRRAELPHEIPARIARRDDLIAELAISANRFRLTLK